MKEVTFINHAQYVKATYRALTDVLLPEASIDDSNNTIDSDLGVHDYIIYALDHYVTIQNQLNYVKVPLSYPTALLLDAAATQLVIRRKIQPQSKPYFPQGGLFTYLSKKDRLITLATLENLQLDLFLLPFPFQNNAGLIKYFIDALNRFSMFGYYSEWSAYGTTRLYPPQERRLEYFPYSWEHVGYPGVSLGYRDFRGFLLMIAEAEGNDESRT